MLLFFASQLLQYYTILCDGQLKIHQSSVDFHQFLEKGEEKHGNTHNNLFILEHHLLKHYNALVAQNAGLFAVGNEALSKFAALEVHVCELQRTKPEHAFIHYLNFLAHYSQAKSLDLQFSSRYTELSEPEKNLLQDQQRQQLSICQDLVKRMRELQAQRTVKEWAQDLSFNFGQPYFNKLKMGNLDAIQQHLCHLSPL